MENFYLGGETMTFPGSLGYGAPRDPIVNLVRRIEDLERAQRETSSQLVTHGAVAAQDGAGNLLSLAALAFNGTAVETAATFTVAGGGAWHVDPAEPTITVAVSTGRLLVTVSAVQFSSLSASNVVMSWSLTGPTMVAPDNQRGLVTATPSFPAQGYGSGSYTFLHSGLLPGEYTVQAQYRCDPYGASTDSGVFENRCLIVQPY
jgi:hypothetical protein